MENKIREYVVRKFAVYPNTKKIMDFREKLILVMVDKYRKCQSFGMSEQKSYALALSVMNNYSKEAKLYSAKVNTDMMPDISSYMLFGGIA